MVVHRVGDLMLFFIWFLERVSCDTGWSLTWYVTEDNLELLPLPPVCYDYNHAPSYPVYAALGSKRMHSRQALYQWAGSLAQQDTLKMFSWVSEMVEWIKGTCCQVWVWSLELTIMEEENLSVALWLSFIWATWAHTNNRWTFKVTCHT